MGGRVCKLLLYMDRSPLAGPSASHQHHHVFFGVAQLHSCDSTPRLSMPFASRNQPSSPQYTPMAGMGRIGRDS